MQLGLVFTFKREDFTPSMYIDNTYGDLLDIVYIKDCLNLNERVKSLTERYHINEDNQHYIINDFGFLKGLVWLLRDEVKAIDIITNDGKNITTSMERYREQLLINIRDLEWLMMYLVNNIAASELFQKLSGDCFDGTGSSREQWLSMCKNWGNEKPENFEVILWMK